MALQPHRQLNPIPVFQPLFKDPLEAKICVNPQMPVLYGVLSMRSDFPVLSYEGPQFTFVVKLTIKG